MRCPVVALFMGAIGAKAHNSTLKASVDRLADNDKPKMVALIAIARKRLTILDAIIFLIYDGPNPMATGLTNKTVAGPRACSEVSKGRKFMNEDALVSANLLRCQARGCRQCV